MGDEKTPSWLGIRPSQLSWNGNSQKMRARFVIFPRYIKRWQLLQPFQMLVPKTPIIYSYLPNFTPIKYPYCDRIFAPWEAALYIIYLITTPHMRAFHWDRNVNATQFFIILKSEPVTWTCPMSINQLKSTKSRGSKKSYMFYQSPYSYSYTNLKPTKEFYIKIKGVFATGAKSSSILTATIWS